MFAADDSEANNMPLIVKNLEPLRAVNGGDTGDQTDLTERSDGVRVSVDDVAGLDEVLVGLWVVEAADHGPDGGDGGADVLDHGGAALVGAHGVGVEEGHGVREVGEEVGAVRIFGEEEVRVVEGGGARHWLIGGFSVIWFDFLRRKWGVVVEEMGKIV